MICWCVLVDRVTARRVLQQQYLGGQYTDMVIRVRISDQQQEQEDE